MMNRLLASAWLVGASLLGSAPEEPSLPALPKIRLENSRSGTFEVACEDSRSVSFAITVAETMESVGQSLTGQRLSLVHPISVRLTPIGEQPYTLSWENNVSLIVFIRWDESTTFDQLTEAIACAWMVNWARGNSPLFELPAWLREGAGLALQARLRPALADDFHERAKQNGPVALDDLFQPSHDWQNDARFQLSAYALLKLLADSASNPEIRSSGIRHLANGGDWRLGWDGLIGRPFPDDRERNIHWAVAFENLFRARELPILTLAESQRRLERLSTFSAEIAPETEARIEIAGCFPHRDVVQVRIALEWRIADIKAELFRINPCYRNALISLGLTCEAALEGSVEAFNEALSRYLEDRHAAENLHDEISRLLADM